MVKQAFLVDDSKSARIVLSRLLKKNGFDEVEMAESGEDALEQLKTSTPDAIFVDFLMDGMDGLETITEIKKDPRFSATPVVMCTANEGDEYVRAAVDHGALGILAKPPTDQSLGEIIDMIEEHQREVAANDEVEAESAPAEAEAVVEQESQPAAAPVSGVDEEGIRRIAAQVAEDRLGDIAARRAEQVADELISRQLGERVEASIKAYLDEHLEPLVSRQIEQRLSLFEVPKVDTDDLRSQVVQEVNSDLEEFVRQLNQRTVEGLIEASIYEQISEVANDFSQRLSDTEQRIMQQVPEKNEMIDHIRVVTEGSMEAHVQETATQVAQEISNSVATETVETLLDQHLAHQAMAQAQSKSKSPLGWILGVVVLAAAGVGAYLYFLG